MKYKNELPSIWELTTLLFAAITTGVATVTRKRNYVVVSGKRETIGDKKNNCCGCDT